MSQEFRELTDTMSTMLRDLQAAIMGPSHKAQSKVTPVQSNKSEWNLHEKQTRWEEQVKTKCRVHIKM